MSMSGMEDVSKKKHVLLGNVFDDYFSQAWLIPESTLVKDLIEEASLSESQREWIECKAIELIENVRKQRLVKSGLDAFMIKYDLSSEEGVVLMCLAEALLRVPDRLTMDKLIQDKLSMANWAQHQGQSPSMFVNAMTWSLMLTGKILNPDLQQKRYSRKVLKNFLKKSSQPFIRRVVLHAMKILGQQYVMGETIELALKREKSNRKKALLKHYNYSYDMLGEAACTNEDAEKYFQAYRDSIVKLGEFASTTDVRKNSGISVKLSALHPRYERANSEAVHLHLYDKLLRLMLLAKRYSIGLNIDAEEVDRLELSLEIFERLAHESQLKGWDGLGIVVQAYQKRAYFVLDFLVDLAHRTQHRFMVRLVKGAYWDTEIKHAQVMGLPEYMVFTQKCHTDISYRACVKKIFQHTDVIYPQFASHNALTVAVIMLFSEGYKDFEFQCLYGMGDTLYDYVLSHPEWDIPCRVYAPVGIYEDLLPYLVRRLLENGANSSFVNRIMDEAIPISDLTESPDLKAIRLGLQQHHALPSPRDLFKNLKNEARVNALGMNITDLQSLKNISEEVGFVLSALSLPIQVKPLVADMSVDDIETSQQQKYRIINPANKNEHIGDVQYTSKTQVNTAICRAGTAFLKWDVRPASERADILNKVADLLERDMVKYIVLSIKEAGKTLSNAVDEVREAIDFCRYYANAAIKNFSEPTILPGPTGELNQISMHGRGIIVCISPWNFPLAIFLGQVTAAIAAGNVVLAKPAEQTSIIAYEAVRLMYEAGVPEAVVQLLPGEGEVVGAQLIASSEIAGVIFTGSTEVAKLIQQTLSHKAGPIVPLIAETGGQNCMVVDSSALPEQVVKDVIKSAFDSAGQRCSALRVLYLQEDIAEHLLQLLEGAMAEITLGDPIHLATDVGPVIDVAAQSLLTQHILEMKRSQKCRYEVRMGEECSLGTYITPTLFELDSIHALTREVFGPILHVVRFKASELQVVVNEINQTGYGLTFGIHSRIQETVDFFMSSIKAGNIYVNRNIVGAVVGVQPFGGQGLSGTGPKAGGPLYLHRLAVEKTVSVDTTASGGNASLMMLD